VDARRWERVQELFHRAVELPHAERPAFLLEACPADPELQAEVEALLERDERTGSVLDRDLSSVAHGVLTLQVTVPERIGPYRVLGVLGEGGMGVVLLAERPDLGNRVAVKMLRDATLSPARRERFTAEQRTLARLTHPSIARLYDADALPDGTPYFVMELVEGRTLTEHCRVERLGLAERLRLFREVCIAVGYAHGRAIVHRDLKPSNILVTREGSVKLLDFGIARQLDSVDVPGDPTRTGLRLLTPSYAAPEQVRGEPLGVFTDIYALGVILYELLADRLPFDLAGLSAAQAERRILEEAPPAPSEVARGVTAGRGAWSDLDVLCLTAMHRDPGRRYGTVDALVRDLDRFLAGAPLEARPDSLAYRAGKFIRRRRGPVTAAALLLFAFAGLLTFHTVRLSEERSLAQREAAKAAAVSEYLIGLFEASDPFQPDVDDLDVRTLLARGVERADALADEPDTQAQMLQVIGRVHTMLSDYGQAEGLLTRAVELRRAGHGSALDLAASLGELGNLRRYEARLEEAEALLSESLDLHLAHLPPDHPDLARVYDDLGVAVSNRGRYDEAEALLRAGLAIRREAYVRPHVLLAHSLNNLGVTLARTGDYAGAERYLREALEVGAEVLGPDSPSLAVDLANLGVILESVGNYAAADSALSEALRIQRARLGDDHAETAFRLSQLGAMLRRAGELDRAEAHLREALEIEARTLEPGHRNAGVTRAHLGGLLRDRGELAEAEPLLREAVDILAGSVGERHEYTATIRCHLAEVVHGRGGLDESEALFRDCLEVLDGVLPPDHDVLAGLRSRFGALLTTRARFEEAEPHLVESHGVLLERFGPDHAEVRRAARRLAELLERTGRAEEAARLAGTAAPTERP
jgi:eukaryotic-like serine/threonine-protein kinase